MNNTSRTITFILLSSIIMMVAITLQNRFFPPKIPLKNQVAQNDLEGETEGEEKPADASGKDLPSATEPQGDAVPPKTDSPSPPSDEKKTEPENNVDENQPSQKPGENEKKPAQSDQDESTPNTAVVPPDPSVNDNPNRLVALGSLDIDSQSRFLYTLNTKGASIRRIESSTRKKNGRYLYRDLETKGGYLGELDCEDTPEGCRVRIAGPGTPAAQAGILAGDLLVSVEGKPVESATKLKEILAEHKAGKTINVAVSRTVDGSTSELTLSPTLTEKPIEFLRPERSVTTKDVLPESFLLTLHQVKEANWVEIDNELKTKDWELNETTREGNRVIEFSYVIPKAKLQKIDLDGPLTIIKRYWLEPNSADDLSNLDSQSWHLFFEVEIQNRATTELELGYQLDGPTGTPTEGWWYQIKINGSGSFIGMAGARDVVGETNAGHYSFLGGPGLVTNLQKDPLRQKKMYVFDPFLDAEHRSVKYIGVDSQYFHVSLLPEATAENPFIAYSGLAWPTDTVFPEQAKLNRLVDCTGVLLKKVTLGPNQAYQQRFKIFSGPKEADLLEAYGLENNRAFGWFGSFSKPLCWLLHVLYAMTFKISYAIPVILLTMIVRSLMIPISRKAALNAQMMQYLSPQMKEIKQKYPEDMQKQAQAQRELFKQHKYNPLSGCLMGFVQLPIFIGLYRGLSVDIALRDQPLLPGLNWCTNLAAPDQLLRWDSWMPAFLASDTGWLGPYLNILPLVTIVLFVTNAKLFTPPPTDDQQAMMQKMMTYMMFFMGFLFFKVPAALCLYFITSSIWGIAERKLLPKPKLNTDKLSGDDKPGNKSQPKQDDFSNTKAMEEKKKRDRDRKKKLRDRDA